MRGVFLDRDGTIIEDRGHLGDPSLVRFLPGAFEALRRLQEDFLLLLVTNQSGISAGTITQEQADQVNHCVVAQLAEAGICITSVYVCPHSRQDGCCCIKPLPHFLQEAARQYDIDLGRSFSVGDHPHDVEFGLAGGGQGIYVLTGHGQKHLAELRPDAPVTRDIGEAADRILTMSRAIDEINACRPPLLHAAKVIRNGGTVAFPTETVYGLGASGLNAMAVARIFQIKQRPRFNPLILHVSSMAQARDVVQDGPEAATALARRFWPGPLTLVLPRSPAVPEIVTAGLPTVALRMPDHPLALALIQEAGVPVAAPSANPFGRLSPTCVEHVRAQLGHSVDAVLDGGPCRVGIESTIVALAENGSALLRAGGAAVEDIESIIGPLHRTGNADRPRSPGQCQSHYAPRTRLVLCEAGQNAQHPGRAGLLTLTPPASREGFAAVEALTTDGDLREAAANLFAALHRLDQMDLDIIVATPMPDSGLGLAMNDRLRRAAHPAKTPASGSTQ